MRSMELSSSSLLHAKVEFTIVFLIGCFPSILIVSEHSGFSKGNPEGVSQHPLGNHSLFLNDFLYDWLAASIDSNNIYT